MPELNFETLAEWLANALDADGVKICDFTKLKGGAIQENWRLDILVGRENNFKPRSLVLRTDAASKISASLNRSEEYALLQFVSQNGIKVPVPIAHCDDKNISTSPFFIMDHLSGTADARTITRDPQLASFGADLVEKLGQELAKLHLIDTSGSELFLPNLSEEHPADQRILTYRKFLDNLPTGRPVIEFALNWLEDNKPVQRDFVLCHCDFRTGNLLIDNHELVAILDWEFSTLSDPFEDIGWFCARCWRFGNDHLHAGGIAKLENLMTGYKSINPDMDTDRYAIAYWQLMAEVRWAIIALQQAARCESGKEVSLELSLTGRMVAEMELNMLTTIKGIEEAPDGLQQGTD